MTADYQIHLSVESPVKYTHFLTAKSKIEYYNSSINDGYKKQRHQSTLPLAISRLSRVQVRVGRLDHISSFLPNHIHRVLDSAIGDDRNDRSIDDTEVLDSVDPQLRIDDTLLDALGETTGSTRI